jgi:hypothetical protein
MDCVKIKLDVGIGFEFSKAQTIDVPRGVGFFYLDPPDR